MPLHLDRSHLALNELGREGPVPTLLLLHDMGDSGRCWPDAVSRWGGAYRILAADARGHGRSPRFTTVQLQEGAGEVMLADTVTLLEDLAATGVDRPVLVGHSMGAAVAALAATVVPELVRAVVLEDPAWRSTADAWRREQRRRERVTTALRARGDVMAEAARGRVDNPTWPDAEIDPWARSTAETDHAFLDLSNPMPSAPWMHVARALRRPTLLVTGTHDVIVDAGARLALGDIDNPMVEVAVVDGAGHCVRRDRAEGYHRVVDPWLAAQFHDADHDADQPADEHGDRPGGQGIDAARSEPVSSAAR